MAEEPVSGPVRFPNGVLRVPITAYDIETGALGDGVKLIQPGDDDYDTWLPFTTRVQGVE